MNAVVTGPVDNVNSDDAYIFVAVVTVEVLATLIVGQVGVLAVAVWETVLDDVVFVLELLRGAGVMAAVREACSRTAAALH